MHVCFFQWGKGGEDPDVSKLYSVWTGQDAHKRTWGPTTAIHRERRRSGGILDVTAGGALFHGRGGRERCKSKDDACQASEHIFLALCLSVYAQKEGGTFPAGNMGISCSLFNLADNIDPEAHQRFKTRRRRHLSDNTGIYL